MCIRDRYMGKEIIEKIKSQVSINDNAAKRTLLYIVNEAVTNKYSKNPFLPWLFEQLVPICYEYVVDEDSNIKNSASSFAINIVTSEYSYECFQVIFAALQTTLKKDNWRLRYIATCDILSLTYVNWLNVSKDISTLVATLYDPVIEISTAASRGLVNLLILCQKEELMTHLCAFRRDYLGLPQKEQMQCKSSKAYGSVLGIVAIVKGYGAIIPEWLPDVLEFLSKLRSITGEVGNSVRLCFSEFWEKHKKDWETEKSKFTSKQIEILAEYVSPYNYYA
eukprot:TRINITY_DN4405_c0_g2_i2.p1 TRINITY_DN4405_c0_g2~~TRINITY_DN4405_c0_g2_i2.p1  ORF type:complete len:279 (+),score=54.60 TRINITY_DN4405_c0_g2_i2:73-909(+)